MEERGRFITCKICGYKFRHENDVVRKNWKRNKLKCPQCNELYCVLPKTERILRKIQDKFLESNREEKYINEMYHILINYSQSIILKNFSKSITCKEDLEYYSQCAVSYFIEEYYARKDFYVKTSFAGLLIFKIKQALYGKMEKDIDAISLDFQFEDDNFVEYEDDKFNIYNKIENEYNEDLIRKYLTQLSIGVVDKTYSLLENYARELAFLYHIEYGEKASDRLFSIKGKAGKYSYMWTLHILKNELLQIHHDNSEPTNN